MKYFKYSEMLKSDKAKAMGLKNIPNDFETLNNIMNTIENLEAIREAFGFPIIINSGFRSVALNKAVGGVSNSHHLNGYAADIITTKGDMKKLYDLIKNNFKFTQLIWENNGSWIHVSFVPNDLKCQAF